MNNLSNNIYDYYITHFAELPLDKQLHFASRLWLWRQDEQSRQLLDQLRPAMIPKNDLLATLRSIESGSLIPLHPGSPGLQSVRQPYLLRYPELRMISRVLYWASLLAAVYNLNAKDALAQMYDADQLAALNTKLANDHQALAVLSTHAVNFLYLYNRIIRTDEQFPSAKFWQDVVTKTVSAHDAGVRQQLQLYLLTHAVIGESYFYQRAIPTDKVNQYRQLMEEAEAMLLVGLDHASLDNKLEFLVCCQLVNYESPLKSSILTEARNAVSPDGNFLIDIRNAHTQFALTTFDKSEHRSVLFLMATTPAEQVTLLH